MSLLDERVTYKPFKYPWAYEGWLKQQKMHWLPEEVPMHEDVRDWNQKLSPEEKNLLTQIFRFFTQGDCFKEGTEVLTKDGFKDFREITYDDEVAQVGDTMELSFVNPVAIIAKPFKGSLVNFSTKLGRINVSVTPEHRMVYKDLDGEVKIESANSLNLFQNKKILTNAEIVGEGAHTLSPTERLRIAYQADGTKSYNGQRLGYCASRFSFKKDRKVKRLANILTEADIRFTISEKKDYKEFYIESPEQLFHDFSWVNLKTATRDWCKDFIEEISHWDSHVDRWGNITYSTRVLLCAKTVQIIACLAGYSCKFSEQHPKRSAKHSTIYKLCIRKTPGEIDGQHIVKAEEAYEGNVYCVSVPTGKIVVRSNNQLLISGNCDVAKAYNHKYIPIFGGNPEVLMMLDSFANMEGVHIAAYSTLLDTVGMPEVEYKAFMKFEAMKAKHEYIGNLEIPIVGTHMDSGGDYYDVEPEDRRKAIAKSLAVYSAFTEGMQLFSSFAILLNFARFNKMKGMCQIVTWSVRDESLHTEYMIKLFRTFIRENKSIWTDDFKKEIYDVCRTMVELEDNFIDLAFEQGGIEGLTPEEVKKYVRYIADRRLLQLGLKANFGVKKNPLDWLDSLLNGVEHANFFEQRATEYSKANTTGTWDDVWKDRDNDNVLSLEIDILTTGTAITDSKGNRVDPFVLTPHIETKGN